MTREEALKLLLDAPRSDTIKSNVNPVFTQFQAVAIVERDILQAPDGELDPLRTKRVKQVCQDKVEVK